MRDIFFFFLSLLLFLFFTLSCRPLELARVRGQLRCFFRLKTSLKAPFWLVSNQQNAQRKSERKKERDSHIWVFDANWDDLISIHKIEHNLKQLFSFGKKNAKKKNFFFKHCIFEYKPHLWSDAIITDGGSVQCFTLFSNSPHGNSDSSPISQTFFSL